MLRGGVITHVRGRDEARGTVCVDNLCPRVRAYTCIAVAAYP